MNLTALNVILALTNAARKSGTRCGEHLLPPAPQLEPNQDLNGAAAYHAWDMMTRNYFSHIAPDPAPHGRDPCQRAQAYGFNGQACSENIAAGQPTPEKAVEGWLFSPAHCENIMNPALLHIGIGHSQGGQWTNYWVQRFG